MSENIDLVIFVKNIDNFCVVDNTIEAIIKLGAKNFDSFSYKTHDKIDGSLQKVKEIISREGGNINFILNDFQFSLGYNLTDEDYFRVGMSCHESLFKEKNAKRFAKYFINITKGIWNAIGEEKIYGLADGEDYVNAFIESKELDYIPPPSYWLDLYGTKFVEEFGKERMLSAPTYKVEELNNGILVINSPLPEYLSENLDKNKLYEYFGWKFYTIEMVDENKPSIRGKQFQSVSDMQEYLEKEIQSVKENNPDMKVSVYVYRGYNSNKEVSPEIKSLEKWLVDEMNVFEAKIDYA